MSFTIPFIIFSILVTLRHLLQFYIVRGVHRSGKKNDFAGTFALAFCYLAAGIPAAVSLYSANSFNCRIITGLVVMEIFVIIRFTALLKLGKNFSYEIRISNEHKLVRDGIYSLVRHPLHLAFWGETAGFAIAGGSPISLAAALILLFVIIRRNRIEDRILQEEFGEEFARYKEEVPSMNILKGIKGKYRP